MSFRKLFTVSLLTFLLFGLIACSSDSDSEKDEETATEGEEEVTEGGEIRVAYSADPSILDLHTSDAIGTAEIMGHVFETLITTDSDYNIKPMLAESFEQSEDGLTVTFNLREGVKFHNGKEMTAEDVVASLNRWKDGTGGRGQFDDAEFVEVDEYTVELQLAEPLSTALNSISQGSSSFAAIMPKESIENADEISVPTEDLYGTGPFKLEEYNQGQYVHLTKFDDYEGIDEESDGLSGKKEALVDDIYFDFVSDPSTRVAGIQSGEYDIAAEVPYDNVEQLDADENIENQIIPGAGTLIMFMNKKIGPFADVKAREALSTLVDIEQMMTAAFSDPDYFTVNHNMMMPHQEELWYSDAGKDKHNVNDPEKAKALFEEAGYDGEEITIMTSRDYEFMYSAAVVLQSELEAIGVNAKLENYDWATLISNMTDETKYDINMVWLGYKPEPTAHHFLGKTISGWTEDEKLDELIDKFIDQPTLDDAIPVYDEIQEWFYDYIPAIKIGDYNRIDATRTSIDNYQYSDRMILWNVTNNN